MFFTDLQLSATYYLAQDKYNEAITLYQQCIEANPTGVSNYWHLGLALLLQGEELAAQNVWRSIFTQGKPEEIEAWKLELIKVLEAEAIRRQALGNFQQAKRIYWQIVEQAPNNLKAHERLATALIEQSQLDEAITCLQKILALKPDYPDGYYNLANALMQKGHIGDAIACYQQAITLKPDCVEAYKKLGNAFLKQGNIENAINSYQQAFNVDPNYIEANYIEVYNNMGVIFEKQGQPENAIACYKQALNLNPNYIEAYKNLGAVFTELLQLENAIACYQQILNLNPSYTEIYNNLGAVFEAQGEHEQAMAWFIQALELNPNDALAHLNRAILLLQAGDLEQGFAEYEWRWQCSHNLEYQPIRALSQPFWDGSNLDGRTILLHSEQGFGDTIQFIRYASLVAQRGGRVVVECQEPLVRLLTTVAGVEQLVVKGKALPEFDVHALLMSLPRILGTTLENLPAQVPYLAAPELPIKLKAPTGTRLKVGIVWAGSSKHQKDRRRSCSLNHFLGLVNTPSIAFYSLQTGPRVEELIQLAGDLSVQDLSTQLSDFADTAAAIAQLDLVITVDTSVAHLAGALNKPVWVLLSFNPDWRWMIGRSDSPWYPTMRLFRQESPGDWAGLLKQVETALQMVSADPNPANSSVNLSESWV